MSEAITFFWIWCLAGFVVLVMIFRRKPISVRQSDEDDFYAVVGEYSKGHGYVVTAAVAAFGVLFSLILWPWVVYEELSGAHR